MSEHTPGPWTWFDHRRDGADAYMKYLVGANGQGFAHTVGLHEPVDTANANLMIAAPDMLAALEQIAKGEGAFSRDPLTHATNVIEEAKATARAAIAKARPDGALASAASAAPAPALHSLDDATTREQRTQREETR